MSDRNENKNGRPDLDLDFTFHASDQMRSVDVSRVNTFSSRLKNANKEFKSDVRSTQRDLIAAQHKAKIFEAKKSVQEQKGNCDKLDRQIIQNERMVASKTQELQRAYYFGRKGQSQDAVNTLSKSGKGRTDIVSPEFSAAANPDQPIEEREMSQEYNRYAIGDPIENRRIHTEHDLSNADVDRILRPILEAHGVKLSDYDPYNLSYKIGEKKIELTVKNYEWDEEFEGEMRFIRKEVNIQKTIFIKNRCSIKGTEILIDFLKAFQREFECSYFEIGPDAFMKKDELQSFHIDAELMYDPDVVEFLEIEDKEAYLQGLENVHK